tara:strand:- start:476 stop:652 length:177 start_codon:yes stop_codon:yes gene_type:complete
MSYDLDERMCFECLYADDGITAKDILEASANAIMDEDKIRSIANLIYKQHTKKKEKSK